MKISIITVSYNSANTLARTIKSIENQTYQDIEYIIIDGASTDHTLTVVNKYSHVVTKVISEKDKGLYYAMNKGIKLSTGDVIGILNSDDFYKNKFVIQKIANEFEIKDVDMVYGNIDYINKDEKIVRFWKSSIYKINSFKTAWHPPHPSLFVKKIVYEKYGHFDTDFKIASDFELMLRFFERHSLSSSYLNDTMVTMLLGGVSNTFSGILKGRDEIKRAFKKNKIRPSFFYLAYRYLPKIFNILKK